MEFRSREQRPAGRFVQPLSPYNGRLGAFLPEPALPRPPPGAAPAPHLGGERRPPSGWKMERELPCSAFLPFVCERGWFAVAPLLGRAELREARGAEHLRVS